MPTLLHGGQFAKVAPYLTPLEGEGFLSLNFAFLKQPDVRIMCQKLHRLIVSQIRIEKAFIKSF